MKDRRLSDFLITTFTAVAVASIDTGIFLFLPENINRVVVIGIITFFGLLIVSAHHEYTKKRQADKDPSEANSDATVAPSAPTSLTASPGNSQITLSWKDPSEGSPVTGYYIYRGTKAGAETILATVGNVLSYIDKDLTNDTSYYYTVSAINSVKKDGGPQSTEAAATPNASKSSEASNNSDEHDVPEKWEGEIMRTSIAGTLILLYVIVIAATMFPINSVHLCELEPTDKSSNSSSTIIKNVNSSSSINKSSNSSSTSNAIKESSTCQTILSNFGNVIIVVIGFYFGSKAAIQIYQNYKGSQGSSNTDASKTTK